MLFVVTFVVFALAMTGLGVSLLFGNARSPQAGCGIDCDCLPGKKDTKQ